MHVIEVKGTARGSDIPSEVKWLVEIPQATCDFEPEFEFNDSYFDCCGKWHKNSRYGMSGFMNGFSRRVARRAELHEIP